MKPISEYNFREIVGHFVIIDNNSIHLKDLEFQQIMAYCYIDVDAGISFKVYGGIINEKIIPCNDISITIRYADDIILDIYTEVYTRDMDKYTANIDRTYMPHWAGIFNDTTLDVYRDKVFPYDMLMRIATLVDGELKTESLWVRPNNYEEESGLITSKTIEAGKIIPVNTDVAIMSNKVLGGNRLIDLPKMIGVTPELVNYLAAKINNGGNNEDKEEET